MCQFDDADDQVVPYAGNRDVLTSSRASCRYSQCRMSISIPIGLCHQSYIEPTSSRHQQFPELLNEFSNGACAIYERRFHRECQYWPIPGASLEYSGTDSSRADVYSTATGKQPGRSTFQSRYPTLADSLGKRAHVVLTELVRNFKEEIIMNTYPERDGAAVSVVGSSHGLAISAERSGIESIRIRSGGDRSKIAVSWAKHQDDVREAQRLRYQVFAVEMGATLPNTLSGHDIDLFDNYCEHLLVRDLESGEVIGTYRVLTPAQALRVGSTYSDTEFDLTRLRSLRERMVELGRSCVHADHRHGGVIMALWSALAEFMVRNQLDTMIGCASIPMLHNGVVSGDVAASIWNKVKSTHLAPIEYHVRPSRPLPLDRLECHLEVDPPALIKGYLRLGAKVLGPPAWDPEFNTADLPMLMRIDDLPMRYRKHFLG